MKQIFAILAVVLMSISMSASGATKSATNNTNLDGIAIEQSVTLDNGHQAVFYYKMEDGHIAVYSEEPAGKYNLNDLLRVQSSSERRVSAVKGKRIGKYSNGAAKRIAVKFMRSIGL